MTKRPAALLIATMMSGSALAQGAPGDANFCKSYAKTVSNVADAAIKKNPACLDYSKGVHHIVNMHFEWCMKQPQASVRGAETNIRRLVSQCTGSAPSQGVQGDTRFCQSYAANVSGMGGLAVKKNPACLDYSKGIHGDYTMHYDRCLKQPQGSVKGAETNIRRLVTLCTGNTSLSGETWKTCAPEGGLCSPPYPTTVRFGANRAFKSKAASGPILCSNAVFGDPLVGVKKTCDFRVKP